ncbi:MAG: tetratricopeptide repeat protein [Planctomycetaceae bacterium]|nr:tetratricopeptide repeat protein [Planctomycetaceae bacterium]
MNCWLCLCLYGCIACISTGCDSEPKSSSDADGRSVSTPGGISGEVPGRDESDPEKVEEPEFDREKALQAADRLLRAGQTQQGIAELQRILLSDPTDAEVLFRMANAQASLGELAIAVELLEAIPEDHPQAGLAALGQAADWSMQLQRFDDAERLYRQVLARAPEAAVVHRQLAFLYNRQGRRHEAFVHLQQLCRLGNVQQDELHAMMVLGHAIFDDPNTTMPRKKAYYPIGPAAEARMLYTASRYQEALAVLDPAVRAGDVTPSILAFYGLLAVESQDDTRFQWWLARADASVQQYAEYWAAIGTHLLNQRRFSEAIRAFAESLNRDPTDIASMRRINQSLTAMGQQEAAEKWIDRYVVQRDVTLASNAIGESNSASLESYRTVAEGLDKLNRPLEAMTWRLFEAFQRKASKNEVESLNQQRMKIAASDQAFPDEAERMCGISREQYPLPELEIPELSSVALPTAGDATDETFATPVFENVATNVGIDHSYQIASGPQLYRFALYQSLGGGAAALDYDLDGAIDLYLAQGNGDPPSLVGTQSNLLYRNVAGQFEEATAASGTADKRYSIGVAAGDWNQDGFDDIVVANVGNKVLLLNNGDGTFRRQEFDSDPALDVLTSSVALGDVTGDALPDIVSLHYVEDNTMLKRPELGEDGNVLTVSPASFVPGVDRIAVNDGKGGFVSEKVSDSAQAPSTGLGVVIADWDGQPGNEIFVGNDVRPNHLWSRVSDLAEKVEVGSDPAGSSRRWQDVAALTGCAHGSGGVSTASMGIAVADFDGNGKRDIHITNFYQEPVSLFMNRGGSFEDRCVQYRLHRDSSSVLGFGCQAMDYNNDGRPDVAVTNGNIEKAPGEPLQQSPQLFVNLGSKFLLTEVQDASGYWQGAYLGRGMTRLDFNHDGRQDFLITHLDAPSALMMNQTETPNHWLAIQLVGTSSERNAIGAQVDVHVGDQVLSNWIVGGDGYLSRNQPTVNFGLGTADKVNKIVVTWPSGVQQTFADPKVDAYLLLVEDDPEAYPQSPVDSD